MKCWLRIRPTQPSQESPNSPCKFAGFFLDLKTREILSQSAISENIPITRPKKMTLGTTSPPPSGENSTLDKKSDKSNNSNNINTQTPKSMDNLENELNRVNHDIREIKNMKIPWEERFDLLSDHIKGCMRHLRILRKEYDDLFGCYEKKFRETRSMKSRIGELENELVTFLCLNWNISLFPPNKK
jgi:hypothetical protein